MVFRHACPQVERKIQGYIMNRIIRVTARNIVKFIRKICLVTILHPYVQPVAYPVITPQSDRDYQ